MMLVFRLTSTMTMTKRRHCRAEKFNGSLLSHQMLHIHHLLLSCRGEMPGIGEGKRPQHRVGAVQVYSNSRRAHNTVTW